MFSAVPMMRIQAVVLERDERAVLKALGRMGALQLTRTRSAADGAPPGGPDRGGEVARCERIKARIDELRQSLEVPSLSRVPPSAEGVVAGSRTEITLNEVEDRLRLMEERAGDLLGQRRRCLERQKDLTATIRQMSRYRGFDIPLDGLDRYSFLHFAAGTLPVQNLEPLQKGLGDRTALVPLVQEKGRQSVLAIASQRGWPDLEKALQQAGFEREDLPVVEGTTVDGLSTEAEREQLQISAELEGLKRNIGALAAEFAEPLAAIERFVESERLLLDASQHFSRTESTVLLAGWVPAETAASLEGRLSEITGGLYVMETSHPDELTEEQIPVLLKHSRLLRPFEMLVSTYGLPDYRELEPTLFVALSYVIMFGMMFGDVGHGAVLAAFGLVALLKGKSEKAKDFGILLLFAGSSSIVFGAVYGSYFGIEELKHYALWHDPLEGDPMQLMYGAIGLGIAIISIGLILNIINRFRSGDIIGAFLDKFGLVGLLFYWGILFLLTNGSAIRSRGLMTLCLVLFFGVPVIGWALKEPLEHIRHHAAGHGAGASGGIGGAIAESCVGAFEAILSYLANTISFVRLAAYAMSHAALLFAAFMVAAEVRNFPIGGSLWSLFIIILGNIVAIVLEGIIASVQALRLEYYEFFGKFFSGSGRPFEPFRLAGDDDGPKKRAGG